MITLKIEPATLWDDEKNEFRETKGGTVHLEHSLRAISKWESWYGVPFLGRKMNAGEMLRYCYYMCLDEHVSPVLFYGLSKGQLEAVREYINLPMTATWFGEDKTSKPVKRREIVTAELVYFWMSTYGIDWQAQDWHFNKLMTLIRVCSEKNKPEKERKIPKHAAMSKRAALNAARRKRFHTSG